MGSRGVTGWIALSERDVKIVVPALVLEDSAVIRLRLCFGATGRPPLQVKKFWDTTARIPPGIRQFTRAEWTAQRAGPTKVIRTR